MDFQQVKPQLVKLEMRNTTGVPAWMAETKRPGGFGRFLSGVGRMLGAISVPLSFAFPPAALAAAGMYGVSQIGDQIQYRSYTRAMDQQSQKQMLQNVVFPGLGGENAVGPIPAHGRGGISPAQDQIMNVLFSRDDSLREMAQGL